MSAATPIEMMTATPNIARALMMAVFTGKGESGQPARGLS